MLIILTKTSTFNLNEIKNNLKLFLKFLIGQNRGPAAVTASLLRGLKELNFNYKYNVKDNEIKKDDTIYINENAETLAWAIEAKKQGKINRVITGPNITILPDDKEGIMLDKNIDLILFPSQWTKDFWTATNPELADKIKIWPAGVGDVSVDERKEYRNLCLIYQKNADGELLNSIVRFLKENNENYKIIKYGQYKQKRFFKLLNKSKIMIVLSKSESQGLALAEAWIRDVPTLVWNRGFWECGGWKWFDDKITAPHLSVESGLFFKNFDDFKEKWMVCKKENFKFMARSYALKNFTNKISAENFLKIINL